MNKEIIEKISEALTHYKSDDTVIPIKELVFRKIIPEVLKSVIPEDEVKKKIKNGEFCYKNVPTGCYSCRDKFKQKVKELYNIDL